MKLIYLEPKTDENPLCQCPACNRKGRLMDMFSLLKVGFNGIKAGSKDDVDKQECPCGAKLSW